MARLRVFGSFVDPGHRSSDSRLQFAISFDFRKWRGCRFAFGKFDLSYLPGRSIDCGSSDFPYYSFALDTARIQSCVSAIPFC